MFRLHKYSTHFKSRKMMKIDDLYARNLVSEMLTKDPLRRPTVEKILSHPFMTGQKAARMIGEEAQYDVFISYRVASDAINAERLYQILTAKGFRVW
jgi:serine/threonine protein kinase